MNKSVNKFVNKPMNKMDLKYFLPTSKKLFSEKAGNQFLLACRFKNSIPTWFF